MGEFSLSLTVYEGKGRGTIEQQNPLTIDRTRGGENLRRTLKVVLGHT